MEDNPFGVWGKLTIAKFKFQGRSARSQRWFDLEFDWIEVNFRTCDPDFYKKLFLVHEDTQDTNTFKLFQVPIGNSKYVEKLSFTMMPQWSSILISSWMDVVSVIYSKTLII